MAKRVKKQADVLEGQVDILVKCKVCGKPITVSNKYGMFCEDLCNMEEEKRAYTTLRTLLVNMGVLSPEKSQEDSKND